MDKLEPSAMDVARRKLGRLTHRVYSLPVLVLMPHSGCNCRCVMCDIWKANRERRELSRADLARHVEPMRKLGVRQVVLSGGEALMHSNLWALCSLLKELPASIVLLSTGLLLKRHAAEVVRWTDGVIVSLDGSPPVHDRIRNVPNAYAHLAGGVAALKTLDPAFPVTARSTLQRANFADLPHILDAAHALGLDGISFLAADVSSEAFNRPTPWDRTRAAEVALTDEETRQFAAVVEQTVRDHAADFTSHFVAESPDKLRALAQYFAALNGRAPFPAHDCNAPWVSTVVEADGTVRPCFFHRPLGNISDHTLEEVLNSKQAVGFRRGLNVHTNPTCERCVCTLNLPARASFPVRDSVATRAAAGRRRPTGRSRAGHGGAADGN